MIVRRAFAQTAARVSDEIRNRIALRAATKVGAGVRVLGWPRIACEGELVIGSGAVLVSSPAPIEILVAEGASLVVGDFALIESGATLRVRHRLVVDTRARIGAGCVLDDDGGADELNGITVSRDAWIEDGAVLLAGTHVPAGGVVARGTVTGIDARGAPAKEAPRDTARLGVDLDARVRHVVARVVPDAHHVAVEEDLSRIKGWDSLCALRVVVALEKEFGVVLPYNLLASHPRIEVVSQAIATSAAEHEAAHA